MQINNIEEFIQHGCEEYLRKIINILFINIYQKTIMAEELVQPKTAKYIDKVFYNDNPLGSLLDVLKNIIKLYDIQNIDIAQIKALEKIIILRNEYYHPKGKTKEVIKNELLDSIVKLKNIYKYNIELNTPFIVKDEDKYLFLKKIEKKLIYSNGNVVDDAKFLDWLMQVRVNDMELDNLTCKDLMQKMKRFTVKLNDTVSSLDTDHPSYFWTSQIPTQRHIAVLMEYEVFTNNSTRDDVKDFFVLNYKNDFIKDMKVQLGIAQNIDLELLLKLLPDETYIFVECNNLLSKEFLSLIYFLNDLYEAKKDIKKIEVVLLCSYEKIKKFEEKLYDRLPENLEDFIYTDNKKAFQLSSFVLKKNKSEKTFFEKLKEIVDW